MDKNITQLIKLESIFNNKFYSKIISYNIEQN